MSLTGCSSCLLVIVRCVVLCDICQNRCCNENYFLVRYRGSRGEYREELNVFVSLSVTSPAPHCFVYGAEGKTELSQLSGFVCCSNLLSPIGITSV
jgi:hypothetical protein